MAEGVGGRSTAGNENKKHLGVAKGKKWKEETKWVDINIYCTQTQKRAGRTYQYGS